MITVAAVGDVHMDQEMRGRYRPRLGGWRATPTCCSWPAT